MENEKNMQKKKNEKWRSEENDLLIFLLKKNKQNILIVKMEKTAVMTVGCNLFLEPCRCVIGQVHGGLQVYMSMQLNSWMNRMTESTRHVFDHLISLYPSVGFMNLPATLKITVSWRTDIQANHTLDHRRVLFTRQQQTAPFLGAWQVRFKHPTLHQVPRTKNNTQCQNGQRRTGKEWRRTWSCCRWYQRSKTQDTSVRWSAVKMQLTQVSVCFGTVLLVSPQLSILPAPIPAARIAGFNSTWPIFSDLRRPCDHGAATSTLESHLDLPDPFIVSSAFDSRVVQQCSCCCVHSQRS